MAVRKGLGDKSRRHDQFHRRAKGGGYRARSVFKLQEIDEKYKVISRNSDVLDLGCYPGSWLQYASENSNGKLVGVDRQAVEINLPRFQMIVGDIFNMETCNFAGNPAETEELPPQGTFDVVLSDMAPDTTGIRHVDQARSESLFEQALLIATDNLRVGGHFLGKLFMGPDFQNLVSQCRRNFEKVRIVKPAGSRSNSIEQYVLAMGRKPR